MKIIVPKIDNVNEYLKFMNNFMNDYNNNLYYKTIPIDVMDDTLKAYIKGFKQICVKLANINLLPDGNACTLLDLFSKLDLNPTHIDKGKDTYSSKVIYQSDMFLYETGQLIGTLNLFKTLNDKPNKKIFSVRYQKYKSSLRIISPDHPKRVLLEKIH